MAEGAKGSVVQVIGTVVDVEFPPDSLPSIYNAIEIDNNGETVVAEVQQHLGNNWVRAVAMSTTDGLARGLDAVDTGSPITVPVGEATLGRVFDVLKRQGETAGPSAPVISFLPDGAIKLRFYAPEAVRQQLMPGTRVLLKCDGCPDGLAATVSFVADEPEFTPPVIYSVDSRQKLVYLIEARPEADQLALQPGQIVDVRLADETKS